MVRNWFQGRDQIIRVSCRDYYDLITAKGKSHRFWREVTASKGKKAKCPSCICLDNSVLINSASLLAYLCIPCQMDASLSSLSIPRGKVMVNLCSAKWRRSGATGCAPSGRAYGSGDPRNYVHVWKKPTSIACTARLLTNLLTSWIIEVRRGWFIAM